jgi:hypothetical protein
MYENLEKNQSYDIMLRNIFLLFISEFEIVSPKVFQHDSVVKSATHLLSHIRQRRSISSEIFINISTHQDSYHIKLTPNKDLLASSFKVYHRHGNWSDDDVTGSNDDITDDITDTDCLYKGEVVSHDNAPAAFSICNGLVSLN